MNKRVTIKNTRNGEVRITVRCQDHLQSSNVDETITVDGDAPGPCEVCGKKS